MTTILLVDDERLVLRSLEKTLLRAGFDVVTGSDCISGWQTFEANAAAIDLAVFDLNMPAFDGVPKTDAGLVLLQKVVAAKPGLPTIVLTAYDDVSRAKEAVKGGAKSFFVKGREEGLVELIRETLGKTA
jgi:DNA-binding NtrC family response regulator